MKTLDEVINELHYWDTCDAFPESFYDFEVTTDALHYLKVLKDILDPLKVKKITHEITCQQCNSVIAILLPELNDPLTWDELREMEGKPVWVEDGLENGEWYIIECFTDSGRFIAHDRYADDTVFKAVDIGNVWQAYRKER